MVIINLAQKELIYYLENIKMGYLDMMILLKDIVNLLMML